MQQTADNKSINRIGLIFLLLGGLFTFIVCGMIVGGIFLDLFGTETTGKLTNISYRPNDSDNSFTPQITFTTSNGEEISFIAWQGPTYFEINERIKLGGYTSTAFKDVPVHYLESFPKLAKVSLALHVEYINRIIWLFWSFVALMIGVITRRNKPVVVDLSQRNN